MKINSKIEKDIIVMDKGLKVVGFFNQIKDSTNALKGFMSVAFYDPENKTKDGKDQLVAKFTGLKLMVTDNSTFITEPSEEYVKDGKKEYSKLYILPNSLKEALVNLFVVK